MQAIPETHARASTLLDKCRDLVLHTMRDSIRNFFENSSMAFYEFADKAQSGSSQIRFMEAMSIIEQNRDRVESMYLDAIRSSFASFGKSSAATPTLSGKRGNRLSLQSLEDSDIQVAVQNMIDTAMVGSSHNLNAIRQRLSVLNGGRKLAEDAIPGGPVCLAGAFHNALQELTLEHESRLVVYFLYDRVVLRKTHLLYEEYNQHLIRAGILPNLIYEVRKQPVTGDTLAHARTRTAGAAAQGPAGPDTGSVTGPAAGMAGPAETEGTATGSVTGFAASQPEQSLPDTVFQDILALLSRKDRNQPPADADGPSGVASHAPLPRQELVTALTDLQRSNNRGLQRHNSEELAAITSKVQQEQVVSVMIDQLSQERDRLFVGLDRRRLPSADLHLIDLVGMMFEYMLRDENIPGAARAELSRLHTPYLKVAILDKGLFTNTEHPAHVLLNALAEAASKWVFARNLELGIFPCLRHIVQRIIDEFDNNLDLFEELLEFLGNSVHNLEERAAAIEERSRQAATGKEKLSVARDRAARAIESRVTGHTVPTELRRLLGEIWLDKLMFIYLREPDSDQSPAWKLATQAIESIVWSVEPRTDGQEREELRWRLPDLNVQLAGTLETLAVYGSSDNPAQLQLLHRLQEAALLCTTAAPVTVEPERDPEPARRRQDEDAAPQAVDTTRPAQDKADSNDIGLTAEEEQALEQLRHISFGTWFAFEQDEDTPARLAKLSWFSQVSGNYMFVDGMGVRAITCKHHELATLLVNGQARILDEAHEPLIQRALRTIRNLLGGVTGKTGQPQGNHS